MNITVYQINTDRDKKRVRFLGLEQAGEIDSSIYDRVYSGDVGTEDLEEIFHIFNVDKPAGYQGASLSVSDVVEIGGKFNYCDHIGWKEIEFNPEETETLKNGKIHVLLCEPGKKAHGVDIKNTLEQLQATVGGYIETFYPFNDDVCIICNEEGKFNGMQPNRAVYSGGDIVDIIFGPFLVVECSGENFGSLSTKQFAEYYKMFKQPEKILAKDGKVFSVKAEA